MAEAECGTFDVLAGRLFQETYKLADCTSQEGPLDELASYRIQVGDVDVI